MLLKIFIVVVIEEIGIRLYINRISKMLLILYIKLFMKVLLLWLFVVIYKVMIE